MSTKINLMTAVYLRFTWFPWI